MERRRMERKSGLIPVIAQRNTTVSWLRVVPVHWEVSDDQESRSVPLAEREVDEEASESGQRRLAAPALFYSLLWPFRRRHLTSSCSRRRAAPGSCATRFGVSLAEWGSACAD